MKMKEFETPEGARILGAPLDPPLVLQKQKKVIASEAWSDDHWFKSLMLSLLS